MKRSLFEFQAGAWTLRLGRETKIMGVLNVTPDSFSDGGAYADPGRAVVRALEMEREGAHILDIGGESTRPGAPLVPVKEEIRRVLPVLKRLRGKVSIPISVDTSKWEVAEAALNEGAVIVNDVTALRSGGKRLAKLVARRGAGLVLMHMLGTPLTMQKKPVYRDPAGEVCGFLKRAIGVALEAGIPRSHLVVDPGFGFGKTPAHNMELLAGFSRFASLGCPLLAGMSRKSFIGSVLGGSVLGAPVGDRLYGSLAAAAAAIERGAHLLRVHDVAAHRQVAAFTDAVLLTKENR